MSCTFAVQAVVCGFITGNESNAIMLYYLGSPGENSECKCTGAIVSASILAVMFFACGSAFTIIFLVMVVKVKKSKRLPSIKQQSPAESNYEVVEHKESSSGVINTGKNIAYGQVHT
jgi:preprotein translocase subunit SecG